MRKNLFSALLLAAAQFAQPAAAEDRYTFSAIWNDMDTSPNVCLEELSDQFAIHIDAESDDGRHFRNLPPETDPWKEYYYEFMRPCTRTKITDYRIVIFGFGS